MAEDMDRGKSTTQNPPPPDGGWGWIVVFASFMIHVIADGVAYSFGLFFVEISREFGGKSAASWIGSILLGVTFGSGPIASAFVNRYGCRAVSIAGSFVAAFGFALSYYATSLGFLYVTVGVIGGLGLGLIYLPAIVCVSCYFEKKRATATGIAVCGSGFGTFLLAPLCSFLIAHYGWRASLFGVALILLNCIIFAAMFRPLSVFPPSTEIDFENPNYEPGNSTDVDPAKVHSNEMGNRSIEMMPMKYLADLEDKPETGHGSLRKIDDLEEIALQTDSIVSEREPISDFSDPNQINPTNKGIITSRKDVFFSGSVPHIPDLIPSDSSVSNNATHHPTSVKYSSHFDDPYSSGIEEPSSLPRFPPNESSFGFARENGVGLRFAPMSSSSISTHHQDEIKLSSLSLYNKNKDGSNNMKKAGIFSPEFIEVVKSMTDFGLLANPIFLFFATSNFLTNVGFNVPYIYLADMAKENLHVQDGDHALGTLVSCIGVANTISRVVLGYFSDRKYVNRLHLYSISLTLCGIATGLAAHSSTWLSLRIYALIFGATGGVYVGLTSVILVDLLGLDKLSNAFGIVLLFQGVGTVIGPVLVGELFDAFQNYVYGFWLAGVTIAISGSMLFLIPLIQLHLDRQLAKQQLQQSQTRLNSPFYIFRHHPHDSIS